jgi:N-acetylneuraminic acid mutarotase
MRMSYAFKLMLLAGVSVGGCRSQSALGNSPMVTSPDTQAAWISAAPMAEPRQELYPETLDGKIYVAGGINNPNTAFTDSFDAYDPVTDQWTKLASLPEARHHITLTAVNGRIYGIGGFFGGFPNWRAQSTMWIYDPSSDNWTDGTSMLSPRAEAVAAAVDGQIYWIGGRVPELPNSAHFNEHKDSNLNEAFNTQTNQWEARAPAPTARNSAAAAVIDGKIYVVGGRQFIKSTDGKTRMSNYAALEVYDPRRDSWETKTPMPQAQGGLGAATIDGKLYACGGEQWLPDQRVLNQCWVYDPGKDSWASLASLPVARHGIGMVALGRQLHVFGGATTPGGNFATSEHVVLSIP